MQSHSRRHRATLALLGLLLLGLRVSGAGAAELYRFAPAGAWVLPATTQYEAPEPQGKTSNGAWHLALDTQINVTAAGDDWYRYTATKITGDAGVEEQSEINLYVDPSYQTIDIHFLRVRRGAQSLDARPAARITALPEETQLRERIYNGSYNINILLADVRVGDVVEYAYTTHSREMLFRDHYADSVTVGWSVPIHWQRVRVRAPLARRIRARLSDGSTPQFTARAGARELLLEWHDLAGIPGEDDRPKWYSPWLRLDLSDYEDWAEVVRVVEPLYAAALKSADSLADATREIAAGTHSQEELALRALQFVQEQVRYVSISIGPGGYRPTQPGAVLQRRYGDCKDKSVLLVALLRRLHIDAQPALVHTRRGHILPDLLPTPYAFDHAIVRMQIGASTYWVDGTRAKQYAALSTSASPRFENALLVSAASDRLTPIPRPASGLRRKDVTVTVDLRAGMLKPGKLTIVTRYDGALADEIRPRLANKSLDARRAEYLDYITRYYSSAKSAGPLQIRDDKTRDTLEISEQYTLAAPFVEKPTRRVLTLHADELYDYADPISSSERRAPLALEYPIRIRQHIDVLLPENGPVTPAKVRVDNPAFRYAGEVAYSDRAVHLTYEYEALQPEVAPAAFGQYLVDRKRFYDDLGYNLSRKKMTMMTARAPTQWPRLGFVPLLVLMVSVAAGTWLASFLMRWDPPAQPARAGAPSGLGGWLILPAIYLLLESPVTAWLAMSRLPAVHGGTWQLAPLSLALTVASGVLLVVQLAVLRLFFTRRTSAPYLFVAVSWLSIACWAGIIAWTAAALNPDKNAAFVFGFTLGACLLNILVTLGLSFYMARSQRVRATFAAPFRRADPAAPVRAGAVA